MNRSTPTGFLLPEGTLGTREEVILPPEFAKMLAVLGDTAADIHLGLHCSMCGQDVVGKNARADTRWILECACRTFVGGNPLRAA
jgi:hypothetical protein